MTHTQHQTNIKNMDKTLDIRLAVAKVKKWGWTVGITGDEGKGTPSRQYRKLLEEVGELGEALIVNDKDETIDAIGDCAVVLILLAELKGLKFEDCLSSAYSVIEDRIGKGKMVNGEFKKDA